jgi:hypothetical protein
MVRSTKHTEKRDKAEGKLKKEGKKRRRIRVEVEKKIRNRRRGMNIHQKYK